MENKHHDMYRGQPIVLFPDLFCQTDAEGQPGEAVYLVYLVGGQPIQLPAADITKKQKLWFISKFLLACTNQVYIHNKFFKSLHNPDAVRRRLNKFAFFQWVNPKYIMRTPAGKPVVDPSTNRVRGYEKDDAMYAMIDPAKIFEAKANGTLETVWFFRRLSFTTGTFVDDKVYSTENFYKLIESEFDKHERANAQMRAAMVEETEQHVNSCLARMMNPEGEAQTANFETMRVEMRNVPPPEEVLEDAVLAAKEDFQRKKRKDFLDKLAVDRYARNNIQSKYHAKRNNMPDIDSIITEELEKKIPGKKMFDYMDFEIADGFETAEDESKASEPDDDDPPYTGWQDCKDIELETMYSKFNPDGSVSSCVRSDSGEFIDMPDLEPDYNAVAEMNNGGLVPQLNDVVNDAMMMNFDAERESNIGSFISKVSALGTYTVTEEVYNELVRLHRDWRLHVLREVPGLTNVQLQAYVTLRNRDLNLINPELWFRILRHFSGVLEHNPLVKNMYAEFKLSDMLYFGYVTREEINRICTERRFNYYYRDGYLGRLNEVYHLLSGIYNSAKRSAVRLLRPVYDVLAPIPHAFNNWFWNLYFQNPLFQIVANTMVLYTTVIGCVVAFTEVLSALYPKKSKSKKDRGEKVQEKLPKLREAQAGFDTGVRLQDLLVDYNDNFVGFYIAVYHPNHPKVLTRLPCMALFLCRRTAILVNHGKEGLMEIHRQVSKVPGAYVEVVLVPYLCVDPDRSTERFKMNEMVFDQTPEMAKYDISAVTFKHARNRPNITKFIPPVNVLEKMIMEESLKGVFYERPFNKEYLFQGNCKTHDVWFDLGEGLNNYGAELSGDWFQYKKLSSYSYKSLTMTGRHDLVETKAGYCGMTGWLEDPRRTKYVNMGFPQASQPWLIYFHTSRQQLVPNGVPMFREMFQKYIEDDIPFTVKPVLEAVEENLEIYAEMAEKHLGLKKAEHSNVSVIREPKQIDNNHMSLGHIDKAWFNPGKSELKKTELFDKDENTRWPALLRDMTLHGEYLQVMYKAIEPYGANVTLTNKVLIDQILQQLAARIMSNSSAPENAKLMDLYQCLYGDEGYNLNSVNWQSSMGFYLRMIKDMYGQKWKGKIWMKGEDDKLKPEVYNFIEALFNHYDEKLRRGEAVGGVNIDNLKDELLAKQKVLEGNSRLFCTSDFIELLLFKRYTGAFAGWIYKNRVNNGIAIGVNPYSSEWDAIMEKLQLNSPLAIFCDHKKFDKNQLRQVMKIVLILMTMYYNDKGSVEENVRELLFENIINSVHVVCIDGKLEFYRWDQGNTSGNFLTAILNSLVNWAYMYICAIFAWLLHQGIDPFMIDVLPKNPCDEALQIESLGDDVIATVKAWLMEGVNFNTIVAVGKKYLGITITDELKSEGKDIPDFRPLEGGSFLGRTIVLEKSPMGNRWRGVLRRYSVLERNFWYRGTLDPKEAVANIESSFLEAAIDPDPTFHAYCVKKFAAACKHCYGVYPNFTDYATARKYILTLATYKWEFNDFKTDLDDDFPDLRKILAFANRPPQEPTLDIFGPSVMPVSSDLVTEFVEDRSTVSEELPRIKNDATSPGFLRRL
jgi:hypothetical protein